jgi:hypothetical protein
MLPKEEDNLLSDYHELVIRLSSSFLSCAAIFLNTCLELPGNVVNPPGLQVHTKDYASLLSYLHLPPPQQAFADISPALKWILHAWCRDLFLALEMGSGMDFGKVEKIASAEEPFRLLPLPNVYQDLFTKYLNASCSLCEAVSHQTGLCLLCGAVVCADNDCCSTHARQCGASLGMFLIVNTTAVLLLRGISFLPSFLPSSFARLVSFLVSFVLTSPTPSHRHAILFLGIALSRRTRRRRSRTEKKQTTLLIRKSLLSTQETLRNSHYGS